MPPPKAKLHKNTGKSRQGPPQIVQTASEPQPSTSSGSPITGLTPEQEQQFEAELYWCIQQLQIGLSSNKLNNKQVQDHTKALNTLISTTAPMIKKRQVMRLSFGDYREKMAAGEKKTKNITITVSQAKPNQKSVFIRKAIITPSHNNFQFNFPRPEYESNLTPNGHQEKMEILQPDTEKEMKNTVFAKSDNNFKFNFSHEQCSGDNDS